MNTFFKTLLVALAALPFLASCSMDGNADVPRNYAYVVVNEEVSSYYFTGDDDEIYYPAHVRGGYDAKDKDGKRAVIYFNIEREVEDGYDVAIYEVYDILSKEVEVADTEEKVEQAGDDRLMIWDAAIQGDWLDIAFRIESAQGATHKLTLLDNRTLESTPPDMPEGYQYLEFRQKAENLHYGSLNRGSVSFRLSDEYHPAVTGKKGLYIRIVNMNGNVEYYTVNYRARGGQTMQHSPIPLPYMSNIW